MPLIDRDCCAAYKVLVLGEASVGKSALVNCLMGREFRESMVPTIGVDFVKKIFEVDGALIQLVIWDTAGQQRFRSITRLQYRGVQGIVLVYDVTNLSSFAHLAYWITSVHREMKHAHNQYEPIPIVLCGNKADLDHKRQVKKVKAFELAQKEMAFEFFETSAKTGSNVFTAFQRLAFHITDICNPKLMVSYHPYLIRRIEDSDSELLKIKANIDQKKKDKKSKKKPKSSSKKQLVPLAKTNRVQCSPFNGLCCLLPQKQELT
ncbi:hypothetical protein LOTGIDRAFT_232207 [Lottia gigantea]|uniref:SOCS box domain-containing protein n=1 Tax=Lottia gigantea TaxID=225164 RepID=V4AE20_LOTGI|nr:hypothetical protein LOTGIDRAFT_232207 [Lottia gigantea]ESO95117.1 hypothetical protein LOTGIDRAFT_232207 [Lottia gigantea]